jgi:hypothetical protein
MESKVTGRLDASHEACVARNNKSGIVLNTSDKLNHKTKPKNISPFITFVLGVAVAKIFL